MVEHMIEQVKVLILGHGEMGRAMECLLKDQLSLEIWERHPKNKRHPLILEEAAAHADIILFCLPVNPHRDIAQKIRSHLKKNTVCLSIAKGLDEAGQTAAQIFDEVLGADQPHAFLYGPMISEEIRAGHFAFAQLGCENINVFKKIHSLFSGTNLYLEYSSDIKGISWSVILKNVYALVFGMADELQLGDNMRGYFSVAALNELDKIVRHMGGEAGSPYHLAGLGDLITTATSEDSHHHELGRMLARGESEGIKGEGIHTLEMVKQHKLFNTKEYPLFYLIDDIVGDPNNVHKKINEYLKRVYS